MVYIAVLWVLGVALYKLGYKYISLFTLKSLVDTYH